MKKRTYSILKLSTLSVLCFVLTLATQAQVDLSNGLIAHYQLDVNASDNSSNANHGIMTSAGVYPTKNYCGISNKALLFNGAVEPGVIDLPSALLNGLPELSMSFWFNPSSLTNGMSIVGQDNVLEAGFYTSPSRVIIYHPTSGGVAVNITGGAGDWQHILVTCSGTQMKIYLNGILANTQNGNFSITSSAYPPRIGGNVVNQSNNSWFRGKIDEVRFYTRILTNDEIALLSSSLPLTYNIGTVSPLAYCTGSSVSVPFTVIGSGIHANNTFSLQLSDVAGSFSNPLTLAEMSGTTGGTFSATIPANLPAGSNYKLRVVGSLPLYIGTESTFSLTLSNPSEGLSTLSKDRVLYYPFNGNTNDNSGFAAHATPFGGVSYVEDRFGTSASAVQLNGSNGYLEVPADVWFENSPFTASCWVKPNAYNNWSRIFDFSNGPASDNVVWALSNGTSGNLYCDIRQGSTTTGNVNGTPAPLNKWSHCALTYDGSSLKIYLNGNLVATGTSTGARMIKRTQCYIGRSAWTTDAYANASYDDFMIWQRLLTEEEIKVLAYDGIVFSNSPVCEGNSIMLSTTSLNSATYSWSGPSGFTSVSAFNTITGATATQTGTYYVTVSQNGCIYNGGNGAVSVITPGSQASATISGLPASTYTGAVTNTLTGTPAGGYFSGPGISGTVFNPSAAGVGTHTISYNYLNPGGCVSTAVSQVIVGTGYNMSAGTITTCQGGFFDSGGRTANYSNNENMVQTFCSDNGEGLRFWFKAMSIGAGDTLWVYDGADINSPLIAMYIAYSNTDYVWSSGTCLTFRFKSDGSTTTTGWEAEFQCYADPSLSNEYTDISAGFRTICSGVLRDPGGSGNYTVPSYRTQTFRSSDGNRLKFVFTMLTMNGNNGGHWVSFYDGPTTAFPKIGSYNEWAWPPASTVETTQEWVTVVFDANNTSAGSRSGFEANISCTTPAAETIVMDNTTHITCNANIYDHAGPGVNYAANRRDTMVLCSGSSDLLFLTFNHNETQFGTGDTLWVFDGNNVTGELLAMYISGTRMDNLYSLSNCLTFVFHSNNSNHGRGWQGTVSCVANSLPVTYSLSTGVRGVCNGTILDPGGSGNYSVPSSTTQTYRSLDGKRLKLDFTLLNLNGNNGGHWLHVYDGPNSSYPRIGSYNEWAWPAGSVVESSGEYLTLAFDATNTSAGSRPGFDVAITCTTPILPLYPMTNNLTVTACEGVFYDDAGPGTNYNHNRRDTMTFCSGSTDFLVVDFNHNESQFAAGDTLLVFDGNSVSGELLGMYITGSRIDKIVSLSTCLTFVFHSNATANARGWQGYISCVTTAPAQTINLSTGIRSLCSGIIYDPAGTGSYSVPSSTTQTLKSQNGMRLKLTFSEMNLNGNNGGHWLSIYDGPNNTYPLIGSYNEWAWPPSSVVESTGEYLTLYFNATNTSAGTRSGFTASIECTTPALPEIWMSDINEVICDAVVYDNGGLNTNYFHNTNDTMTLCSSSGQLLQITFNHNVSQFGTGDTLWIYDGADISSPQLGMYITGSRIDPVVSTGTCLTFHFKSDASSNGRGWQGYLTCISVPPSSITYVMSSGERNICSGVFQDPGGSGNYPTGTWTETFTSYSGERIRTTLSSFAVNGNNGGHWLSVYDGTSTASPLIGSYNNYNWPPAAFQSTGSSLTFRFNSTNTSAGNSAGWVYNVSCFTGEPIDVEWLSSPVCQGAVIPVSYTLNSPVNAGNTFTVQLSNAAGSFTSPINIGNVTSDVSGSINAIIPPGTPAGNGYRIRIISSDPIQISSISPNPLTVTLTPTSPTISASGTTTFCEGSGNVTLSVPLQQGVNYRWIKDGNTTVGANSNTYSATTGGIYTVELLNSCDTVISANSITVNTVSPAPVPSISANGPLSFCQGGTVQLSVYHQPGLTYQWFKDGLPTGSDTCILNVSVAGIYTVSVSNACGTVSSSNLAEAIITGTAPSSPTITSLSSESFCMGGSVILEVPWFANASYNWLQNGQPYGTDSSRTEVTTAGVYSVAVTNLCGSASSSNSITVSVLTPPDAPVISASGPLSFCSGNEVTLSVPLIAGNTYQWTLNGSPAGSVSHTITTGSPGIYSVDISNACGTTPASNTMEVVITGTAPSAPVITANGSTSFCQGGNVNLSASTVNGIIWSTGETTQEITVNTSGFYYAFEEGSGGCISDTSNLIPVDVMPLPLVTISSSAQVLCPESSFVTLTVPSGNTYQWSLNGTPLAETTHTLNAVTSGDYSVTVTGINGCTASADYLLTEGISPTVSISANSTEFCQGSSLTLTAGGNAAAYAWLRDGNPIGGANNIIYNATLPGAYSVLGTGSDGCQTLSDTLVITVIPLPVAVIQAPYTSLCNGMSVTLTVLSVPGSEYTWFHNGNNMGLPNDQLFVNVNMGGNYYCEVDNGCSATSNTISITTASLPAAAGSISGTSQICSGDVEAFSISAVSNATSYAWEVIPSTAGYITSGQGTTNVTIAFMTSTAQVKVTPVNVCGNGTSSTKSITLYGSGICSGEILFSGNPANICQGGQVVFTNYTSSGMYYGYNKSWNFGIGASPATASGNGPHTVTYNSPGYKTITLSYVDPYFGDIVDQLVKTNYIHVGAGISAPVISGPDSVLCAGGTAVYTVSPTNGSVYNWTVPTGATILAGQTSNQIFVQFGGWGGTITVTETTSTGCQSTAALLNTECTDITITPSDIANHSITVFPNPASDILNVALPDTDENFTISLYNPIGQLIYENTTRNTLLQVDVSLLADGLYLIRVSRNHGQIQIPIVIKK